MDRESDKVNRLAEACASAGKTIEELRGHMRDFAGAFSEDRECWRGEAASEEHCFVSSDKEYLDELLSDVEVLIDDRKSK
ncbi:MAG: hypothetical protein IJH41_03645 [Eubacterium sp.]|nr:hypothetical protein [Eubacterium sp.]